MDTTKSTSEEQTKQLTFPEFLDKSFETLFNQNNALHQGLQGYLQANVENKISELKNEMEAYQQAMEITMENFTQRLIKALDKANDELCQRLYKTD